MITRIMPNDKYNGAPCSYVATGCAYEDVTKEDFPASLPDGLRDDGWLTLENENRFVRQYLPIRKKVYYRRNERISLKEFLANNAEKCVVCVYGHLIYVDGKEYWSFFDNDDDMVVCVWYIKE